MTSIEICNSSLAILGMPPVVSLEDESNSARQCRTLFPILRDRVLRDHLWSFATAFAELQQLAEASPEERFSFVCALPADLIRVISIEGSGKYRKIAGKKILVQALPARIAYIRRVTDSGEFDGCFAEALQYLLAAELCMANTRDGNLAGFYRQEYEHRLAAARSIDSAENIDSFQHERHSSFLAARHGLGERRHGLRKIEGDCGIQGV